MKHLLTFLILISNFLGISQIDQVTYGPEYLKTKKSAFNGFIGESDMALFGAEYVFINKKKHTLNISKYHKGNLSLIETKNIYSNPKEGYYNKPIELYFLNNQFWKNDPFKYFAWTVAKSQEEKEIIVQRVLR